MSAQSDDPEWALVTGASRGIGLALARELARHGHNLVLVARAAGELEALAASLRDEFGAQVRSLPYDLARRDAPGELFEQCEREGLKIATLVNNAAFGVYGPFVESDGAIDVELLDVNILSAVQLTKRFVRSMLADRRGQVVNVASTGAFRPGPLMATYYASKAYLSSWSQALARELAGSGVTVTTLCPGPTESNFAQRAGMPRARVTGKSRLIMSADDVARIGYRGMMRGQTLVIPGLVNHLQANAARVLPRRAVTKLVHSMLRPR